MSLTQPQVQPNFNTPPPITDWPSIRTAFATLYRSGLQALVLYLQGYLTKVYNAVNGISQSGTLANRPAFGNPPQFYYATDSKQLFYDTGSAWITIQTA